MVENPNQSLLLDNGLTIHLDDQSRRVTADRWLVSLAAKIDVPVGRVAPDVATSSGVSKREILAVLGETVTYEFVSERNFIHEDERQSVFESLVDSFLKSSKVYLARPEFPGRFVLRQFKKSLHERQIDQQRHAAMKKNESEQT